MITKVFVVTGGNKGVGKSIVKLLLQDKTDKVVYLTSRNEELGQNAVKDLDESFGLKAKYHQLDISDFSSIDKLRKHLVENYGGLDVLVNNAGIAYKGSSTVPFAKQAEVTNDVNFFGTMTVCRVLFPILKPNAKVVNVSSMTSEFAFRGLSADLKAGLTHPRRTLQGLQDFINDFVRAAKDGEVEERGFVKSAYGISKLGVSFMTSIQQNIFDKDPKMNIVVNSCCPGLVDTDMTGGKYPNAMPPDQGADTPTYLALLPDDVKEPRGKFCKLRTVHPYPPLD